MVWLRETKMFMQFLQWIQLLVAIYVAQELLYLLLVELRVFAYIMMDNCNTD